MLETTFTLTVNYCMCELRIAKHTGNTYVSYILVRTY